MKKALLLLFIAILAIPISAFANASRETILLNFSAEVGGEIYYKHETVIVPPGKDVTFKVFLMIYEPEQGVDSPLRTKRIHFDFYDENNNHVYHERDTTALCKHAGEAKVKVPDVRQGEKIRHPGKYELYMHYYGKKPRLNGTELDPCSLGPITVVFE